MQLPRFFMLLLAATVALAPFSLDAYLPALPNMAESFNVDVVWMNYTMSAYMIGFGLGQLFGGPLSDQIGRRTIGLVGLSVYMVATLGIILSSSVEQLLVLRTLQALGGGFTTITVLPMIRDVFPANEVGTRYAGVFLIMLIAPLIAPIVGVALLQLGWHWIFGFLLIYSLMIGCCFAFFLPETRRDRQKWPNFGHILPQYWRVLSHRVDGKLIPVRYAFSIALSGCVLMVYLTNASFIFQVYYGLADSLFPIFFGACVLGVMLTNWISMRSLGSMSMGQVARYFRIGMRTQLIAIVLLAVAVSTGHSQLWIFWPLVILAVSMVGINQPAGSSLYLSEFHHLSGSASAIMTTTMFGLGGMIGALSSLVNDGTLISFAGTMLTVSLVANLLLMSIPKLHQDAEFPHDKDMAADNV